jgi:D-cysteine desulfhydrase
MSKGNWRTARVDLGVQPTPLIDASSVRSGLWIKDDGRVTERYGGNKPRKLEYLLHGAPNRIATMGAMGSHHCLATAVHGLAMGHDVHVVTFPRPHTSHVERVLQATAARATMHHVADIDAAKACLAELGKAGALAIPAGGSSARGALGFVQAGFELIEQVEAGGMPRPERVYAATGTGGTVIGLAMALAHAQWATEVIAVRVVPEAWLSIDDLEVLARDVQVLTGITACVPTVDDGWLGAGYGASTSEAVDGVEACADLASLETTYTGKAFAAVLADPRQGPTLFWQTHNTQPLDPLLQDAAPVDQVWS